MTETRALYDGLNLTIQAGFDYLIMEGDNKIVIQAIEGKIYISWQIHYIMKDIQVWRNEVSIEKSSY